jgi:hypothetical protein
MSYVRFAWDGSDVYVYDSCSGGIECCGCRFGTSFNCQTPEEMIAHLATHRRAGHFVPEYAITGLWNAIEGQTKPRKPAPTSLEASSIQLMIIQLQIKHDELRKKAKAEEEDECRSNSRKRSSKKQK